MAKKIKTVADLTTEEVDKLAAKLHGTGANVYELLRGLYGVNVADEAIFARLEKEGKVFKCELCNTWKTTSEKDPDVDDYCVECMDPEEDE